jgi:hypothetical protein
MKEYGIDLMKEHKRLTSELSGLTNRIMKRKEYLMKNAAPNVIKRASEQLGSQSIHETTDVMLILRQIVAIEKAYSDQTVQLDMFRK